MVKLSATSRGVIVCPSKGQIARSATGIDSQ
jgi:hypothetical protein